MHMQVFIIPQGIWRQDTTATVAKEHGMGYQKGPAHDAASGEVASVNSRKHQDRDTTAPTVEAHGMGYQKSHVHDAASGEVASVSSRKAGHSCDNGGSTWDGLSKSPCQLGRPLPWDSIASFDLLLLESAASASNAGLAEAFPKAALNPRSLACISCLRCCCRSFCCSCCVEADVAGILLSRPPAAAREYSRSCTCQDVFKSNTDH